MCSLSSLCVWSVLHHSKPSLLKTYGKRIGLKLKSTSPQCVCRPWDLPTTIECAATSHPIFNAWAVCIWSGSQTRHTLKVAREMKQIAWAVGSSKCCLWCPPHRAKQWFAKSGYLRGWVLPISLRCKHTYVLCVQGFTMFSTFSARPSHTMPYDRGPYPPSSPCPSFNQSQFGSSELDFKTIAMQERGALLRRVTEGTCYTAFMKSWCPAGRGHTAFSGGCMCIVYISIEI